MLCNFSDRDNAGNKQIIVHVIRKQIWLKYSLTEAKIANFRKNHPFKFLLARIKTGLDHGNCSHRTAISVEDF